MMMMRRLARSLHRIPVRPIRCMRTSAKPASAGVVELLICELAAKNMSKPPGVLSGFSVVGTTGQVAGPSRGPEGAE